MIAPQRIHWPTGGSDYQPTTPFDLPRNNFGSAHLGICQFVFCDGSVKSVRTNVDDTTLGRLAERADGLPITSDY